jgi:hypothetical protein
MHGSSVNLGHVFVARGAAHGDEVFVLFLVFETRVEHVLVATDATLGGVARRAILVGVELGRPFFPDPGVTD